MTRVYNPATSEPTATPGAEEGHLIDIMFFVERLEGMLANGKKLPLTSNVIVDQAAALELIDELRHAIPEEVQAARRINAEGERILERAGQEAERIVARANEQAAYLIDEQGLTEAAEAEGRRIVADADADAADTRRGADEYAADVLLRLEAEVSRVLGQIERGIDSLHVRDEPEPVAAAEADEEPVEPVPG
jgi:F0F1-type ATP synthase membrane subunit b/b'